MQYIRWFDVSILHFLNQFAEKSHSFDNMVNIVIDSSLLKGGIFMAYFWWLWFRSDSDPSRRSDVLVSLFGASVIVLVARLLQLGLPFHVRPALAASGLGFVVPFGVEIRSLNTWSSFPSDHAALFFALSTAVWYQSRILGLAAMFWTLVVVCLARVYAGYHYPSDIIGGAILGVVLMVAIRRACRDSQWPLLLVHWEKTHRAAFYCGAFAITYEIGVLFDDVRSLGLGAYYVLQSTIIATAGP